MADFGVPGHDDDLEEGKEREGDREKRFPLSIRVVVAWGGGAKAEGGDRLWPERQRRCEACRRPGLVETRRGGRGGSHPLPTSSRSSL